MKLILLKTLKILLKCIVDFKKNTYLQHMLQFINSTDENFDKEVLKSDKPISCVVILGRMVWSLPQIKAHMEKFRMK